MTAAQSQSLVGPAQINPGLPILTMLLEFDWSIIFDLFADCGDADDGPTDAQIRNPGRIAVVRLARQHRDNMKWSRRDWRQNRGDTVRGVRSECAQLTAAECEIMREEYRLDRRARNTDDEIRDARA